MGSGRMESGKLLGGMVSFWAACGGRSPEILQILQILSKNGNAPGFCTIRWLNGAAQVFQ